MREPRHRAVVDEKGCAVSKEVQIVAWCDGEHSGEVVLATVEREVSLDKGPPIVLDLCDVCDKVVQDLQALMGRGVRVRHQPRRSHTKIDPGKGPKPGPDGPVVEPWSEPEEERTCPDERCTGGEDGGAYVAPTRSALNQHVRKIHHTKFADYPGFKKTTRMTRP
jgi:hypothetical protein